MCVRNDASRSFSLDDDAKDLTSVVQERKTLPFLTVSFSKT